MSTFAGYLSITNVNIRKHSPSRSNRKMSIDTLYVFSFPSGFEASLSKTDDIFTVESKRKGNAHKALYIFRI